MHMSIPILEQTIQIANETVKPYIGNNMVPFGKIKERSSDSVEKALKIIEENNLIEKLYADGKITD